MRLQVHWYSISSHSAPCCLKKICSAVFHFGTFWIVPQMAGFQIKSAHTQGMTNILNSPLTDCSWDAITCEKSAIFRDEKRLRLRINVVWWIFLRSLSPKFPLCSHWWNWLPAHRWAITGKKERRVLRMPWLHNDVSAKHFCEG